MDTRLAGSAVPSQPPDPLQRIINFNIQLLLNCIACCSVTISIFLVALQSAVSTAAGAPLAASHPVWQIITKHRISVFSCLQTKVEFEEIF